MLRWGWAGQVLPVAMKRCVASRSCGEIFTLISESESLNREKSCRLLSRCGTLCFFRLSAIGSQGEKDAQNHCWSLDAYTDSLGPHMLCSANWRRHGQLSPCRRQQAADGLVLCLGGRKRGRSQAQSSRAGPYLIAVQTLCASIAGYLITL